MKDNVIVVILGLQIFDYFFRILLCLLKNEIMESAKKIIGRSISINRNKKNISQQQLADLMQVDRQYIWRLENGRVNLTMDYLDKMIQKLDCEHSDFFILNG